MLELWGMRSTLLLPSLPCPLRPGVVAPYMGQMCIDAKLCIYRKIELFKIEVFLHLTVSKQKVYLC